ncbi:MAG: hypothetical protein U1D55_12315 [Phycisphaerae bacterium]
MGLALCLPGVAIPLILMGGFPVIILCRREVQRACHPRSRWRRHLADYSRASTGVLFLLLFLLAISAISLFGACASLSQLAARRAEPEYLLPLVGFALAWFVWKSIVRLDRHRRASMDLLLGCAQPLRRIESQAPVASADSVDSGQITPRQ